MEQEPVQISSEAKGQALAAMAAAVEVYQEALSWSQEASQYLASRGIKPAVANHYGLGFAPAHAYNLGPVLEQFGTAALDNAGLLVERAGGEGCYDRFRNRVMFPIRAYGGEVIALGGRAMDDEVPKYLNSPETVLFQKRTTLYGLHEAKEAITASGRAVVVEGYFDVLSPVQAGVGDVVSTMGTACTSEHLQVLANMANQVVFCFDGDQAGRRAAARALEVALATETKTAFFFCFLPEGYDPDLFVRTHGRQAFEGALANAMGLLNFIHQVAREGCMSFEYAEGRAHYSANLGRYWREATSEQVRDALMQEAASLLEIDVTLLQQLWARS